MDKDNLILFKWCKNFVRETRNSSLNCFMKEHGLENKATKGSKLVEVANKLKLKDFNIYIRTDKLTSKQGIINLTDNYKKGTHFVAFMKINILILSAYQPPKLISNQLGDICECLYIHLILYKI